ncbi:MAG: ABC transporter ATP-binding protein [Anaerolineae bacterium]|nr:ABC transporter ATP-binding protein [Anaerolineae bacterium]
MNSPSIECRNLSRTFGTVRALDGLSLEVPSGRIFGFLGPNGAGKTTTIRLLLGLLEPTAGEATVLGYDVRTQADQIRLRTGALLQNPGLYERLTAEDNLEFFARIWHLSAAERRERIRELLTHVGLWERRRDLVSSWSGGMKQKLAVARALLHRPSLVFLDEPTGGLDPVAASALREDLSQLAEREGVTVFLTTHNLAEAEKLCHRVAVIKDGRLVAVGSPEELRSRRAAPRVEIIGRGFGEEVVSALRQRPEVVSVRVREGRLEVEVQEGAASAPLVSQVVAAGGEVEEVVRPRASLEEVFLTLMEEERAD